MNFIALKMLTGDRAKYLGLIFTIAFCTFLLPRIAGRAFRVGKTEIGHAHGGHVADLPIPRSIRDELIQR